jgi:predicted small secreted protein
MFKKIIILVVLVSSFLSLVGCATTQYVGDGIVMQSTPLHHFDLKPGAHTKKGAIKGFTYGGIGGVLIGSGVGLAIAAADVPTLGGFLVGGIAGAAVGAAYYGIIGGIIGTSSGYLSDVSQKNYPHYEIKVKSIPYAKIMTITSIHGKCHI